MKVATGCLQAQVPRCPVWKSSPCSLPPATHHPHPEKQDQMMEGWRGKRVGAPPTSCVILLIAVLIPHWETSSPQNLTVVKVLLLRQHYLGSLGTSYDWICSCFSFKLQWSLSGPRAEWQDASPEPQQGLRLWLCSEEVGNTVMSKAQEPGLEALCSHVDLLHMLGIHMNGLKKGTGLPRRPYGVPRQCFWLSQ